MSTRPEPDPTTTTAPVSVRLDPRRAYAGFGPDDGDLAALAARLDIPDVAEDLADAAEQLDFAYARRWGDAARRLAPHIAWQASADHHEPVANRPLQPGVASTDMDEVARSGLLEQVTAALSVGCEETVDGRTRWTIREGETPVGTASVPWTHRSVEDHAIAAAAARIADTGDLLRAVEHDGIRLCLYEPGAELGAGRGALGYVLTDGGSVVFAGTDFRPSPLHAVDSDRTVEAIVGFLAMRPGDTDEDFFATYTTAQHEWIETDGPNRLESLIADLPGDTEHRVQFDTDSGEAGRAGPVRLFSVRPVDRHDLPTALLLGGGADSARAQYGDYASAYLADTGRDIDVDDDLSPTLAADLAGGGERVAVSPVRGQHTLDWAVAHVNDWHTDAVIPVNNQPAGSRLNVPATGQAVVAIRNSTAVAHAGARVEAHFRARVIALPGSQVQIHPGAYVERRRGSRTRLATADRTPAANPGRASRADGRLFGGR